MEALAIHDVRQIIRLLSDVAVLDADLPGKRRHLMNGLANLIEADMWAWVHLGDPTKSGTPMGYMFLEGGWQSDTQRLAFVQATTSSAALEFNNAMRVGCDVHRTRRRSDLLPDLGWNRAGCEFRRCLENGGIGDFMSSLYPLGNQTFSSMIFLRPLGRSPFSSRDVCIAHIVTEEIDWLHRDGTDVPAAKHVSALSARQRQVLVLLLSGDGIKQIAAKLSLSNFTVNDHLKNIYRRFGVASRGELVAQFLAGGPARQDAAKVDP